MISLIKLITSSPSGRGTATPTSSPKLPTSNVTSVSTCSNIINSYVNKSCDNIIIKGRLLLNITINNAQHLHLYPGTMVSY